MAEISQQRLLNSKRTDGEARRGEEERRNRARGKGKGEKKQNKLRAEAAGVITAVRCHPASRHFHHVFSVATRARDAFDTLDPEAGTANYRLPRRHLHVRMFFHYLDDLPVSRTTLLWLVKSPLTSEFCENFIYQ